jgi:hypothetical protein
MGRSVAKSLFSLSLGPEKKGKCYNGYFINGYVFHTEEYRYGRKTYNIGVFVKGSIGSELEVDYYSRLEEVVELQYHSEQNRVFLFKCYWYDTTDRGIRVDPHYGFYSSLIGNATIITNDFVHGLSVDILQRVVEMTQSPTT